MHGQLEAVIGDLHGAERRLRQLRSRLTPCAWTRRPAVAQWSPAECVEHLNLTTRALLPLVRTGLETAGGRPRRAGVPYRKGIVGWAIGKVIAPSGGLRTRTVPALVPRGDGPPEAALADFESLQAEIIACVRAADGLPIDDVMLVSPFDQRVRYNLYAALTLVPQHQHRHLLQAERAASASVAERSALAV